MSVHLDISPREVFLGADRRNTQADVFDTSVKWHTPVFVLSMPFCNAAQHVAFSIPALFMWDLKNSLFFNPFMQRQKLFCPCELQIVEIKRPLDSFVNLSPWCVWSAKEVFCYKPFVFTDKMLIMWWKYRPAVRPFPSCEVIVNITGNRFIRSHLC